MKIEQLTTPINGTASKVVNQKGCADGYLNSEAEELKILLVNLERELLGLPKGHHLRVSLGVQKQGIQARLGEINKKIKAKKLADIDLDRYIIHLVRKEMSKPKWDEIMRKARALKNEGVAV